MNRRRFIKQIGAGAALLNLAPLELLAANEEIVKISILHTNDLHSRIEAFTYGRNKGSGGMLQLASLLKQIRQKRKIFCFWMQEIFFKELLILTIMVVKLSLNS